MVWFCGGIVNCLPAALLLNSKPNVSCHYLFLLASQKGYATTVLTMMNLITVVVVLAGIVLLDEKKKWKEKIAAGILAVAGLSLLV